MQLLAPQRFNLAERGEEEVLGSKKVELTTLDFVRFGVSIRDTDGRPQPISFDSRRYLTALYQSNLSRIGFEGGRQVEKTTYLAADSLTKLWLRPSFVCLYVCPTYRQMKTYSEETFDEMISSSVVFKAMIPENNRNILSKRTVTGSRLHLRHAFLHADRVRGLPGVHFVQFDELQDIRADIIPVVLETMSHVKDKQIRYAGTHKTEDGTIEQLKRLEGVCHEWVIPCDRHTPRHWNVTGMQTIGKESNVCTKCKQPIDPMHPDAQWAVVSRPIKDIPLPTHWFRINQLMVPWMDWEEIRHKVESYPTGRLKNEVFGEPHSHGTRPITLERLKSLCKPHMCLTVEMAAQKARMSASGTFMGIDWGAGTDFSKTFITVATYDAGKYNLLLAVVIDSGTQVYFADDEEVSEDDPEMMEIDRLVMMFQPHFIAVDHGLGYKRNSRLARKYGSRRILGVQALGGSYSKKFAFNNKLWRYMYSQPEVYDAVFDALEQGFFVLMDQSVALRELIPDILNVIREGGDEGRRVSYTKILNSTDDGFSSLVLVFLATLVAHPRPDLLILEYDTDDQKNPYVETI